MQIQFSNPSITRHGMRLGIESNSNPAVNQVHESVSLWRTAFTPYSLFSFKFFFFFPVSHIKHRSPLTSHTCTCSPTKRQLECRSLMNMNISCGILCWLRLRNLLQHSSPVHDIQTFSFLSCNVTTCHARKIKSDMQIRVKSWQSCSSWTVNPTTRDQEHHWMEPSSPLCLVSSLSPSTIGSDCLVSRHAFYFSPFHIIPAQRDRRSDHRLANQSGWLRDALIPVWDHRCQPHESIFPFRSLRPSWFSISRWNERVQQWKTREINTGCRSAL